MIVLPWPDRKLHPNARLHWRALIAPKAKARADGFIATKAARVCPDAGLIPMRITFYPPDRRHRDDDGMIASFKAYRDGIADAWRVDDRSFKPEYRFADPVKNGMVIVEIIG